MRITMFRRFHVYELTGAKYSDFMEEKYFNFNLKYSSYTIHILKT